MPAKTGYDYDTARMLRAKGFSYKQISEQTSIPHDALARYAHRHEWDKIGRKASDLVSDVVRREAMTFAEAYVQKAVSYGDKALDNIIGRGFDMSLDDLQKLADVATTFDTLTRRSLRLDSDGGSGSSKPLAIQINVDTGHNKLPDYTMHDGDVVEADLVAEQTADEQTQADKQTST